MVQIDVIDIAGKILESLRPLLSEQLGMLFGFGLTDELNKLRSNVSAIQAVLHDAQNRQSTSFTIKNWLGRLEDALYDTDDVLNELSCEDLRRKVMTRGKNAKQVRIFFSNSNQIVFNYRMARLVKEISRRLDDISVERNRYGLSENIEPRIQHDLFDQMETDSFLNREEMIGRGEDIMHLKKLLLNMKDSLIVIAGMGGIGKTTLAKFLYNDMDVSNHFGLKMWVWVGDYFNEYIVVKKMLESVTKNHPTVKSLDVLKSDLQTAIAIGGMRYLLVLDDVWNRSEEEWTQIKNLLNLGARGSKIMITKSDNIVPAEVEEMTSLLNLQGLDKDSSWLLFREMAFKEGNDEPELERVGEEILGRCGGVPLVIRHIGRSLYSKTSDEWMSFKNNELWKVSQENNDMTSKLEMSYNHLSPHLKQCFAYSSLFPKGCEIKIKELISQWVAHGFIKTSTGNESMEDIGMSYFKELCWRFFYENAGDDPFNLDNKVYMHDVMRELAKKVAGNKLYVRGNPNNDYIVSEQTRHISLDYVIDSWQDVLSNLCRAKGLRTFLLLRRSYGEKNKVDTAILKQLFSYFPRLRVLGLDSSNIDTVPDSIKKLRLLQYLDLSQNDIELLPNTITELQNLQTLKITGCSKLKEFPRETSNLVELRHLEFDPNGKLTHIPEGMEKLTSLQTISLFVLDCTSFDELNEIKLSIEHLRIIGLERLRSSPFEDSSVNLKDQRDLRYLTLEWKVSQDECKADGEVMQCQVSQDECKADGEVMECQVSQNECKADGEVMECLEPQSNVESLIIKGYSGANLPDWVSKSLTKLTEIRIESCHRLQHLPSFNHLEALKKLHLKGLRVKFIDKNHDPSSNFFPSLEDLNLEDMPNLEGWSESDVEGETEKVNFPRLFKLTIRRCPKLTSMPNLGCSGANVILCDVGVQLVNTIGPPSFLQTLKLEEIKDLEYLPPMEKFQQDSVNLGASTSSSTIMPSPIGGLHYLKIKKCPNFLNLPERIGILTSLGVLKIMECPKLISLPEGMRLLKSLSILKILGCPELEERCKEGGEDWAYISHVPDIILSTPDSSSSEDQLLRVVLMDYDHMNSTLYQIYGGYINVSKPVRNVVESGSILILIYIFSIRNHGVPSQNQLG